MNFFDVKSFVIMAFMMSGGIASAYSLFSIWNELFLLLLLLEKNFSFAGSKTGKVLAVYHIGLNLTGIMLLVRGVVQVLAIPLFRGMDAIISGMAAIAHILLGVSMIPLLLQVRKKAV